MSSIRNNNNNKTVIIEKKEILAILSIITPELSKFIFDAFCYCCLSIHTILGHLFLSFNKYSILYVHKN